MAKCICGYLHSHIPHGCANPEAVGPRDLPCGCGYPHAHIEHGCPLPPAAAATPQACECGYAYKTLPHECLVTAKNHGNRCRCGYPHAHVEHGCPEPLQPERNLDTGRCECGFYRNVEHDCSFRAAPTFDGGSRCECGFAHRNLQHDCGKQPRVEAARPPPARPLPPVSSVEARVEGGPREPSTCPVCGPGGTKTVHPCGKACLVKAGYRAEDFIYFVVECLAKQRTWLP